MKINRLSDSMQLPPVSKNRDSASESPTFKLKNYFELDEIVRQDSDNPLAPLLEIIVGDIKSKGIDFLSYLKRNPVAINSRGEGYKTYTNKVEFLEMAVNVFKEDKFSNDPDYARIAAWKNDTVLGYNIGVRNQLIPFFLQGGGDVPVELELIDINDLLIGYKTITDEFNDIVLTNSEDYVIKNVTPRMADAGFKSYAVKIAPRHGGRDVEVHIVDYRDKSFLVYYEKIKKLYFSALYSYGSNRSQKWREYFQYKDMFLSTITFPIKQGDDIKAYVSKDIDYAFSLTTHKLQGSTIENTFIDLNDMLFYKNGRLVQDSVYDKTATEIRNKLIYTALSRTSKFAHIYLNI